MFEVGEEVYVRYEKGDFIALYRGRILNIFDEKIKVDVYGLDYYFGSDYVHISQLRKIT